MSHCVCRIGAHHDAGTHDCSVMAGITRSKGIEIVQYIHVISKYVRQLAAARFGQVAHAQSTTPKFREFIGEVLVRAETRWIQLLELRERVAGSVPSLPGHIRVEMIDGRHRKLSGVTSRRPSLRSVWGRRDQGACPQVWQCQLIFLGAGPPCQGVPTQLATL